ncbi:MAG: MFS transporter [Acidobacteria bacterium]|nr:MFS transporter [Acidobacteriota bacterium]
MRYASLLDRLGLHRRELRAWALYDVANSAWMTTILQVFPLFFVRVAASDLPADVARSRFAFATSASVVLVGLTGPVLGAVADYRRRKKLFLAAFLVPGAIATAAMAGIREGAWLYGLTTFAIGNVCVMATLAFYNALLPGIAGQAEVDRVSTAGFAMGYLGGGLLFAVNAAMMASPSAFGLADTSTAVRLSFLTVAVWWVLFSIPLFRRVPEPPATLEAGERPGEPALRLAFGRLRETIRDLRRHRDAGLLLLAFLVYNDAINTIVRLAVTFGDEVGISASALIGALVMVQFVGVPFAFGFGLLADRIGARRALFIALAVYGGISVYAFLLRTATQFFVLAFLVGTVQGGAQALGRSLFAAMTPRHKAGELFGIFGVCDRFGGAFGAMIFGTVLSLTGSSRPAILSLVVFFVLGAVLVANVDVDRGRRRAREAEAEALARA